ncbi:hypothetical protein ACFX13_019783 [Malus domestica]|nr:glutamic acid-rich protein [Malus domestica]
MVEDAQDGESPLKETHDIESQIKSAMRLRVPYFKEQSDSLTFEGVRRVLEKDLGLETFALDVHKRFVKEHLVEVLEGAVDDNTSKTSGETDEKSLVKGEVAESLKRKSNKDAKETCSEDEEKMEDSPVMGLLTGHKVAKTGTEETKTTNQNKAPTESVIKSALRKRGSYIKANSEKITLAGLRRLLEEDLKLEKYTLDPFKKFISQQLDEVLESCEISEPATTAKKNVLKSAKRKASTKVRSDESSGSLDNKGSEEEDEVKPRSKSAPKGKMQKNAQRKASTKVRNNESSGSSDNESSEEEHEVKCRSKSALKGKMQNTDGHKKRKRMAKETNVSGKKRIKPPQKEPEDKSDAEDTGNVSEDDCSQSSGEKPIKKKEVSTTPAYGKRVEHLRSVIKACGMSVAPSVYKKVKQVPENKRETHLIKELEEILSREGLSAHPSEKEIKEVKKKKERAKELEGIDMSNIVMSSRRRSTTSFVPPPKPKIPVESDSDDAESSDDDNDEADNSDKEENEVEDEDIEDNGNSDDNHSDEDEADDSD